MVVHVKNLVSNEINFIFPILEQIQKGIGIFTKKNDAFS
jgi:hypothetical protein